MIEIARAARVGRVTLYAHFPSRAALDQQRRLLQAAHRELDPEQLRRHHDPALTRVEKLIARGQDEGVFRTDLPRHWLVTTFYGLVHAAADDVNAGRLDASDASEILETTLLSALRPDLPPR